LNTILALKNNVTVSGPNGGPFTITFGAALGSQNALPIQSSTANATVSTTNDGGPLQVINAAGAGAAESGERHFAASRRVLRGRFVGRKRRLQRQHGTGAAGGTSTGGYKINVTFSDLPGPLDDTGTFDNSSFNTATVLGVLGNAGRTIAGASISPNPDLSQAYAIQFPGAGDAPGERNIPSRHT